MLASWSPVTTVTQSSHFSSPGAPYPDTRLVSMRLSRGSRVRVIIMPETLRRGDNWGSELRDKQRRRDKTESTLGSFA